MTNFRVGVLGFGGLGQAAARLLADKREMTLVAVADRRGFVYDPQGLDAEKLTRAVHLDGSVAAAPGAEASDDAIGALLARTLPVDGYFFALPNLPNDFIYGVTRHFLAAGWRGVLVDAMKRTSAVEQMLALGPECARSEITYITGCGATPGLLTAAAALAAQSFSEVLSVKIVFGVGIASWERYRATVREDIAHLAGFDVEKARALSDAEVEALLDHTDGLLTLEGMEHADDIMLELAGICPRERVSVGGLVDTRNPKKPISTQMQLTGRTFEGRISTHTFTLGDETSMAANVCGPAFGYLKTGLRLHQRGQHGLWTAADLMPSFVQ
jgi:hypothetical protein